MNPKLGVLVYTCNPSTQKAETGRFQVLVQPELHSEILSQKKKKVNIYASTKIGYHN
jgi:hypothetical protein